MVSFSSPDSCTSDGATLTGDMQSRSFLSCMAATKRCGVADTPTTTGMAARPSNPSMRFA